MWNNIIILTFVTAFFLANVCDSAKILVVFPFPGKSHAILGDGYVRNLAEAGHEITYVTPFPWKNPYPKMSQIDVSNNLELDLTKQINITAFMTGEQDTTNLRLLFRILTEVADSTLANEQMKQLLNDQSVTFDAIIIEWMFSETLAGLSAVYECPFMWSSSMEPHSMVLSLVDESLHPAYNPSMFSAIEPPFTFTERVTELFTYLTFTVFKQLFLYPIERRQYEEWFSPILAKRGKPLPPFDDVVYNASLLLGNSHVSLGQPTKLPQNYISVGGYHIDPEVKPLPEDLKNIIDNAKNGVIYFSMGSNVKSKDMTEELKKELVEMFRGLPYTIVWKFEDILPNLPKNVHILKWAPQTSILAHPNVKLFITHGGLLSTTEAVYFGVPLVGLPVFGDQFLNVERASKKGYAKRVDLTFTMIDELKAAITEVLENPRYAERAKELSLVFHDRPVSPGKELVHWVEHVVRTRGATHLRSPALHVPFYQKLYLDLGAVMIAVILVFSLLVKRFCCSKKSGAEKLKKH